MSKTAGKKTTTSTGQDSETGTGASPTPTAAIQKRSGSSKKKLTTAQKEYMEGMRASVKQMNMGDVRPLSELLGELREEREANDEAHLDDKEI